jgi:hypothetical protein
LYNLHGDLRIYLHGASDHQIWALAHLVFIYGVMFTMTFHPIFGTSSQFFLGPRGSLFA